MSFKASIKNFIRIAPILIVFISLPGVFAQETPKRDCNADPEMALHTLRAGTILRIVEGKYLTLPPIEPVVTYHQGRAIPKSSKILTSTALTRRSFARIHLHKEAIENYSRQFDVEPNNPSRKRQFVIKTIELKGSNSVDIHLLDDPAVKRIEVEMDSQIKSEPPHVTVKDLMNAFDAKIEVCLAPEHYASAKNKELPPPKLMEIAPAAQSPNRSGNAILAE